MIVNALAVGYEHDKPIEQQIVYTVGQRRNGYGYSGGGYRNGGGFPTPKPNPYYPQPDYGYNPHKESAARKYSILVAACLLEFCETWSMTVVARRF